MMDKLGFGIGLTLIGFGTVLFVLFLLQMVMKIQKSLFTKWLSKATRVTSSPIIQNEHQGEPEVRDPCEGLGTLSPKIAAAIAAAIAVYSENSQQPYKVISIRKIWDKEASYSWTLKGQQDLLDSRKYF